MLIRNRQLAVKIESVEGTGETLAAADADLLIYDPKYEPTTEFFDRTPAIGSMSSLQGLPGIKTAKLSGKVEVKGSGSKTTAPSWAKVLKICGFKQSTVMRIAVGAITNGPFTHNETITGGTSSATGRVVGDWPTGGGQILFVVLTGTFQSGEVITGGTSTATATSSGAPAAQGFCYDPTSTESEISSATCALMDDGIQKKLIGARGNFSFEAEAGMPGFFNFELMGTQEDWTDVALFTSVPYETTIPPVLLSAGFEVDNTAPSGKVKTLSFDMQNEVSPRYDINAAGGILSFRVTDRKLTGNFDPEQVLVATFDTHSKYRAGTTLKLEWSLAGSTDGTRVKFIIPQAQIRELGDDERDKMAVHGISFQGSSSLTTLEREVCILHY